MSGYVIYNDVSCESGRALAEALDYNSGRNGPEDRVGVLIRYGSSARIRRQPTRVINNREAVVSAANKRDMVTLLRENFELICPFSYTPEYPCYGFMRQHQRGEGVVFLFSDVDRLWTQTALGEFAYYSLPKQVAEEYRLHICGNNKKMMRKQRPSPNITASTFVIRNREQGYEFVLAEDNRNRRKLEEFGMAIKDVFQLDFCALDFMVDTDNKPWVLEVNSAPSLINNENTKEFYVNGIREMVNGGS